MAVEVGFLKSVKMGKLSGKKSVEVAFLRMEKEQLYLQTDRAGGSWLMVLGREPEYGLLKYLL